MFRRQKISLADMAHSLQFLVMLVIAFVVGLTACAKKDHNQIDLMPAPEIYSEGIVDPFANLDQTIETPPFEILYATDRKPDTKGDRYYLNERGLNLQLGNAKAKLGPGEYTWEEALRVSLLKNRTDKYPVKITSVEEIGILDRSFTPFTPKDLFPDDPEAASVKFAQKVNEKLVSSKNKDVYIYVPGYKVEFSNPLLVATELWHFLGYDGVFIAFSWPSTPKTLAYASDLETTALSAHNLRIFTEFLAEETNAKNIHIIGYSAGTRVVVTALAQAAFIHHKDDRDTVLQKRRIGRVILVGSDLDRQLMGAYLVEGLLKVPRSLSVYLSGTDKALGMSKWVFRRQRLGQVWEDGLTPQLKQYLNNTPELQVIDVTEVEGSTVGNGHAYFRTSPWVSSDILMSLLHDLEPDERGLTRSAENPIWTFSNDYNEKLKSLLRIK